MHGRSLSPILRREAPQWRESILYEALKPELGSRPLVAVRTKELKYIQTFESGNVQQAAFEELYSLRTDVAEMKNLAAAAEQKPTIDRLRAELARLRKAVAETG
jgi:arylsulfatase A-like enzyme